MMPSRLQARTSSLPGSVRPGPVSGEPGTERHAVGEDVRPRPDDPERAQPRLVEDLQRVRSGSIASAPSKCSSIANVPLSRQAADIGGRAHDLERAVRLLLQADQRAQELERDTLGVRQVHRRPGRRRVELLDHLIGIEILDPSIRDVPGSSRRRRRTRRTARPLWRGAGRGARYSDRSKNERPLSRSVRLKIVSLWPSKTGIWALDSLTGDCSPTTGRRARYAPCCRCAGIMHRMTPSRKPGRRMQTDLAVRGSRR